jgi:hypothetical protein
MKRKYDLGRITTGVPFTFWCEKCGWVPASETHDRQYQGGDWDEILHENRHECGTEAFRGKPTFIAHRHAIMVDVSK